MSAALALTVLLLGLPQQEAAPTGTGVGQVHPDVVLPSLEGELVRLSDFRGRKVLLFHFASW